MEIIDNFLHPETFKSIQSMFYRNDFPWYWDEEIIDKNYFTVMCDENENIQLIHRFYFKNERRSNWNITPIVEALGANALVRVKANLNFATKEIIKHGYHVDNLLNCKTAIYYVNSNDGFTEFEDGTRVESVENRVLIFDSNTRHTGTTCTNQKRRIVVNLNYF
jgi:hypothetical protein